MHHVPNMSISMNAQTVLLNAHVEQFLVLLNIFRLVAMVSVPHGLQHRNRSMLQTLTRNARGFAVDPPFTKQIMCLLSPESFGPRKR